MFLCGLASSGYRSCPTDLWDMTYLCMCTTIIQCDHHVDVGDYSAVEQERSLGLEICYCGSFIFLLPFLSVYFFGFLNLPFSIIDATGTGLHALTDENPFMRYQYIRAHVKETGCIWNQQLVFVLWMCLGSTIAACMMRHASLDSMYFGFPCALVDISSWLSWNSFPARRTESCSYAYMQPKS